MEPNDIQQMIAKAIHLPDCPVKRDHAIASRVWLEKQFNDYIAELKRQYGIESIGEGWIQRKGKRSHIMLWVWANDNRQYVADGIGS